MLSDGVCSLCRGIARGRVLAIYGHFAQSAVFETELAHFEILQHGLRVFVVVEQNAVLRVVAPNMLHLVNEQLLHYQVDHVVR